MNAHRQELATGLKAAQTEAAALRRALAVAEADMSSLRARLAARAPEPGGGSGGDGAGGAGDVSYEALQQQVVQVRDETLVCTFQEDRFPGLLKAEHG